MAAVGGSLSSVSIDNVTYSVTNDSDVGRALDGFENEVQLNGDGSTRIIQTRKTWQFTNMEVVVDDSRGDLQQLQTVANRRRPTAVVLSFTNGESYTGDAVIVGELSSMSQSTTVSIDLHGDGPLTRTAADFNATEPTLNALVTP